MHTSTRMVAGDFQFWRYTSSGAQQVDFAAFCPDYHELDRVGVVSPGLEDGVLQTSYALLALTTAFYDCLRERHNEFFDYPQHFAFVGAEGAEVHVGTDMLPLGAPKLWDSWSWLDVWPEAKWVTAPATAAGMMQRVWGYQINRLFWPRALKPGLNETQLPAHAWKMLKTRLKAVYLYGDSDHMIGQAGERVEIRITPAVEAVVQESLAQLPAAVTPPQVPPPFSTQCYELVDVTDFLMAMQSVR